MKHICIITFLINLIVPSVSIASGCGSWPYWCYHINTFGQKQVGDRVNIPTIDAIWYVTSVVSYEVLPIQGGGSVCDKNAILWTNPGFKVQFVWADGRVDKDGNCGLSRQDLTVSHSTCLDEYNTLITQCGGEEENIDSATWNSQTCTGSCKPECEWTNAASNTNCNRDENKGPPCPEENKQCCE